MEPRGHSRLREQQVQRFELNDFGKIKAERRNLAGIQCVRTTVGAEVEGAGEAWPWPIF